MAEEFDDDEDNDDDDYTDEKRMSNATEKKRKKYPRRVRTPTNFLLAANSSVGNKQSKQSYFLIIFNFTILILYV